MATQNVKTTGEAQSRSSQGREVTQSGQRGRELQRGGYDPFGLSLMPFNLLRMDPISLMRRMTEDLDRVFGDAGAASGSGNAAWLPNIEVRQRDGNYVVRVDLPGLKPEDVTVTVTNGALAIEGERTFERDQDRGNVHRSEIRYGRFFRSIPLPEDTDVDNVNARFDNGVLEITIPVPQKQSSDRKIPVQAGSSSAQNQSGSSTQSGSSKTSGSEQKG